MSQFTDWSEHLLAAQKALKTAEACAALKMWDAADRAAEDARTHIERLCEFTFAARNNQPGGAVYEWKEAVPQSGADKL